MADDPYDAISTPASRSVTAAGEVPDDPYARYTSPGTPSPVYTPRAPTELAAAPGDKYRAAAMAIRERMLRGGSDPLEGSAPQRGALLGWGDEISAAAGTPAEMVRQGTFDPREGYRYAKAREDLASEARQGKLNTFGELAGGLSTGAGVLGGTRAGAMAIPYTSRAIPAGVANWGKNVGLGAGLGAVGGAGEAQNIEGIPKGLLAGGALGGFVGGALPAVASAVGHGARVLQMPRLRDPEKVAVEHLGAVQRAAKLSPDEIAQRVADARAAGQPYTYADAVGHEAQRKLAGLAKTPGEQRAQIAETLAERQQNMPYRVGPEINRTLGVQGTAEQAQEALLARAKTQAGPLYREAERHPAWSSRLQEFLDHPDAQKGLKHGYRLEARDAVTEGRKFNAHDAMITNFNEAGEPVYSGVPNMKTLDMAKRGLDHMIEQSMKDGRPTVDTRSLTRFKNEMLAELDAINPAYAKARAAYADPMQIRDAVDIGRDMASRTARPEDTIPLFNQLREGQRQGVRIGYADKLQTDLSGTGNFPPLLRGKVPKGQQELEALTLDQGPLRPGEPGRARKFMMREEEMARTNKAALGGSPTAENLADMYTNPGGAEALGAVTSALTGNLGGVGSNAMSWLRRIGSGESEAQRVAITRALLEGNPDMVKQMAERVADFELRRRGVNPWVPQRPPRYREGE